MEKAFDTDFGDVRIHIGREAQSVGAVAFTWGSSIHFAPGRYNPHSLEGQKLLGHELTHVLQQRAGRVKNPFGSGVAVVQDRSLEAEADRMGLRAALMPAPRSGGASPVQSKLIRGTPVQRYAVGPLQNSGGGAGTISATAASSREPVGSVKIRSREGGVAEITDLHVAPEHRRHGVGKTLMQAAIQNARQRGLSTARLEARPDNAGMSAAALVSMYRRMGFRQVAISPRGVPLMERATSPLR